MSSPIPSSTPFSDSIPHPPPIVGDSGGFFLSVFLFLI